MMLHPEVQRKAREELDAVVGRSRLPDFSDKENLPYVFAIYKELIRWHPILPGGIPHSTSAEDEYKGMRIPKDCIVMPNVWLVIIAAFNLHSNQWTRAMVRDKSVYGPDADLFRPDRFLESDLRDPSVIIYGFGRRWASMEYLAIRY
jgi:cytochrome P450